MKIIIAETVFLGKQSFSSLGETIVVPDRQIGPDHLADADALIIRSKTKVTRSLVEHSPVRFIGTATAGFEHLDTACLDQQGITWTAAPGCNADSVADYIVSALLCLHAEHGVALEGATLGVIGAGQVGARVARRAGALGLTVLINDPPRAAREGDGGFCSLDELLERSDGITLHVPLTEEAPWPTRQMANPHFFDRMKQGSFFINASRGGVVDPEALLHALRAKTVSHAVLDVWDPEPQLRVDVVRAVTMGTPHIAGHSLEGKLNGTLQVRHALCRYAGIDDHWDPSPHLPPVETPSIDLKTSGQNDLDLLWQAVSAVYDIRKDKLTPEQIPLFDRLRASYRLRREFTTTRVTLHPDTGDLRERFQQVGFNVPEGNPSNRSFIPTPNRE